MGAALVHGGGQAQQLSTRQNRGLRRQGDGAAALESTPPTADEDGHDSHHFFETTRRTFNPSSLNGDFSISCQQKLEVWPGVWNYNGKTLRLKSVAVKSSHRYFIGTVELHLA